MLFLPALFLPGLLLFVLGARVVVDDSNSAWTYNSTWIAVTSTNPCSSCTVAPDPARTLNQTWHYNPSTGDAKLTFTGISIEIYTICPPTAATNFNFTLDGFTDGNFIGPQSGCPTYAYNYLVYARNNMYLSPHTLVITNNPASRNSSQLLLDYAIYDDGTGPTPSLFTSVATQSPTISATTNSHRHSFPLVAIVVPAAIAVVLVILTLVHVIWVCRSRNTVKDRPSSGAYLVERTMEQLPSVSPPMIEGHLSPRGHLGASTTNNSAALEYDTTILLQNNLERGEPRPLLL